MAGFGSGRSGGNSGGGSGFGGGSHSSSSSSHHSSESYRHGHHGGHHLGHRGLGWHHHHRMYGFGYGYGGVLGGKIALIIFGAFLLIFGLMMKPAETESEWEKVTAIITNVEQRQDNFGSYYYYEFEYFYNSQTITNTWEDDYYQPVGYTFKVYVNKDNPANFEMTTSPKGEYITNTEFNSSNMGDIGTWVIWIGGGMIGLGVILLFIKKKDNEYDGYEY